MKERKRVNAKEFYAENLDDYINNLHRVKSEAERPLIVKPVTTADQAVAAVEGIIKGDRRDDKKYNKKFIKLLAKSGVKPTVKKVYQNVLVTFFKTAEAEYDYSYSLNGDRINMSPKRISINNGYAEFSSVSQCFVGDLSLDSRISYPWENVKNDMLTNDIEQGYVIANVNAGDFEKDSKESIKQYNKKLKEWLIQYQQKELGKARVVTDVGIYDKEYEYNEVIVLVRTYWFLTISATV